MLVEEDSDVRLPEASLKAWTALCDGVCVCNHSLQFPSCRLRGQQLLTLPLWQQLEEGGNLIEQVCWVVFSTEDVNKPQQPQDTKHTHTPGPREVHW